MDPIHTHLKTRLLLPRSLRSYCHIGSTLLCHHFRLLTSSLLYSSLLHCSPFSTSGTLPPTLTACTPFGVPGSAQLSLIDEAGLFLRLGVALSSFTSICNDPSSFSSGSSSSDLESSAPRPLITLTATLQAIKNQVVANPNSRISIVTKPLYTYRDIKWPVAGDHLKGMYCGACT